MDSVWSKCIWDLDTCFWYVLFFRLLEISQQCHRSRISEMPEIYRKMPHLQQLHLQVKKVFLKWAWGGCWRCVSLRKCGISTRNTAYPIRSPLEMPSLQKLHLQVRVRGRTEDKGTRISTLRVKAKDEDTRISTMRVKDEGCWRSGVSNGDLIGDAVSLVEIPHFLREMHLQHSSQAQIKKNFFFTWRCSFGRFGISSGDLIGYAVFLVEMPHFLRETHLQHPP